MSNDIQIAVSWVDFSDMGEDAKYLEMKAIEYATADMKSRFEKGRILEDIHSKYASHDKNKGQYRKFCEQLKIPKSTAERVRQFYNYVVPNWDNIEDVPDLLNGQFEALARGKVPPQIEQAVKDGQIKTSQEFKAMEAKLKQAERAKEEAERRAEQAEQANEALTEQFDEQAEELQSLKDNPQIVEVTKAPADYDYLKQSNEDLKRDRESYARANDNLRRQLAELQAHNEGMSLQEKAKDDEAFREYMKTKHQEAEDADTFDRAISKLDMLPDNMEEVKEYCRCYLAHHATEANRAFLMKSTAQKIRLSIKKLEAALEMFEQGKLSVVK